jgi:hypothetical protein
MLPSDPVPIEWTADPQRKAGAIKCAVCSLCHWFNPKTTNRCIYGGPFEKDSADA